MFCFLYGLQSVQHFTYMVQISKVLYRSIRTGYIMVWFTGGCVCLKVTTIVHSRYIRSTGLTRDLPNHTCQTRPSLGSASLGADAPIPPIQHSDAEVLDHVLR